MLRDSLLVLLLVAAALHLEPTSGCGVGPNFKGFGGSFTNTDLGDGRTGNYIDETNLLTCDFSGSWACQWGSDGPGNHKWQKASGQVEPAKWDRMFGTTTQPNGEYAIIDLGNGEEPDWLRSDPMRCMKGDGYISFKYWTSRKFQRVGEASVKVCAVKEGSKATIWCSKEFNKDSAPKSPGPVDLIVPGDIEEPFELAFIPSGKGYVAIDEVFFDADDITCQTTAAPTTTPTEATTTEDTVPDCERVACNFDSGHTCSYVDWNASGGSGSGAQRRFQQTNRRIGNPDTGVKRPADGSTYYAGTEVNSGEIAVLEANGLSSASPRKIRFKYWEATESLWLKLCFDEISTSGCRWTTTRGAKVNERQWLEAIVDVPPNTDKIFFVAENVGNNYGAVGVDEIELLVTDAAGNTKPCP